MDVGNSFNNPDKGAVAHAIVHRATWEYLSAVCETEDEAEAEKARKEIFETFVFESLYITPKLTPVQLPGCSCGDGAHKRR